MNKKKVDKNMTTIKQQHNINPQSKRISVSKVYQPVSSGAFCIASEMIENHLENK